MKRWHAIALVLALVAISTGRSLENGFAFDDVPIVVQNAQIHRLAPLREYAQQSYWPPKNLGDAYRPWTVWWLAIQYAVAGETPLVFHLVNLLLTAGLALAVLALLGLVVSPAAAVVGAAIFAVHPVHVEATGNVVGQGELWMALFVTLAVTLYLRARRRGVPERGIRLGLAALYLLAAAAKEQGIVLPGLLLAGELVPLPGRASAPWRRLAPTYLLLGVVGVGFLVGRYLVLGDLGGGPPAAGLQGLSLGDRALVMAPLALDWIRLLVWPAKLSAQYSPPAQGGPPVWSLPAIAGLVAVGAAAALFVAGRRRAPVVAFGLAWFAVAILPVSNVLFPTGILLAERTLLLPSVAVALVGSGIAGAVLSRRRRAAPVGVAVATAALVTLGAIRSWQRQPVWRDNDTLFAQTIVDSPNGYRSYYVYARELFGRGWWATSAFNPNYERAKSLYRRAAELYGGDRRVFEDWGFILRAEGRCEQAVPVLERGVAAEPAETLARSRLFECLLTLGRYRDARVVAEAGVAAGAAEFEASAERARRLELGADAPRAGDRPGGTVSTR
ncbi:MAG: tetratricopeptide repeat protein [Gemmatimonadales bacterium]